MKYIDTRPTALEQNEPLDTFDRVLTDAMHLLKWGALVAVILAIYLYQTGAFA